MNLEPIILGLPAQLENMQEAFRLMTKRASRIQDSQMLESRAQQKALEKETPIKGSNLWLCNGMLNNNKSKNQKHNMNNI